MCRMVYAPKLCSRCNNRINAPNAWVLVAKENTVVVESWGGRRLCLGRCPNRSRIDNESLPGVQRGGCHRCRSAIQNDHEYRRWSEEQNRLWQPLRQDEHERLKQSEFPGLSQHLQMNAYQRYVLMKENFTSLASIHFWNKQEKQERGQAHQDAAIEAIIEEHKRYLRKDPGSQSFAGTGNEVNPMLVPSFRGESQGSPPRRRQRDIEPVMPGIIRAAVNDYYARIPPQRGPADDFGVKSEELILQIQRNYNMPREYLYKVIMAIGEYIKVLPVGSTRNVFQSVMHRVEHDQGLPKGTLYDAIGENSQHPPEEWRFTRHPTPPAQQQGGQTSIFGRAGIQPTRMTPRFPEERTRSDVASSTGSAVSSSFTESAFTAPSDDGTQPTLSRIGTRRFHPPARYQHTSDVLSSLQSGMMSQLSLAESGSLVTASTMGRTVSSVSLATATSGVTAESVLSSIEEEDAEYEEEDMYAPARPPTRRARSPSFQIGTEYIDQLQPEPPSSRAPRQNIPGRGPALFNYPAAGMERDEEEFYLRQPSKKPRRGH